MSDALTAHGVDHSVVGRRGDGLEFGVALADRVAAISALAGLDAPGWYVEWTGAERTGVVPARTARSNRHVIRAREWNVFQAFAWGDQAVGSEQGAVIGFWEAGTSGLLEKIGDRGQERFDSRSPVTTEIVDGRPYPGRAAFPVGANLEHVVDPIDIVYTWVDGADPDWQEAFRSTAERLGRSIDETALDP
ncbi:Stealth CR1 domain-containing protein, partial [Ilumatobacter sp.]|uniref:Stealth CR1 domain-containing protein n=1 Tax=Ilumatobacter sp. TaxID=1967498 RepID=UPI003C63766D